MGTRADFWIGHGPEARWLGSVAMDGYEWHEMKGGCALTNATSPADFQTAVRAILASRRDATTPEDGWPWPWKDSNTTDFAYVFDEGSTHVYCFGRPVNVQDAPKRSDWRDMSEGANVTLGPRSGITIIRGDIIP